MAKVEITKELRENMLEEANKELARRSYHDYITYIHKGRYKHFSHTLLLCDYLDRIANGESLKLLIEMPPRHGKSITISETFPSYYLSKNPGKRVIATSYSDELAAKFGNLNKAALEEYGPSLFGVDVSSVTRAKSNWGLEGKVGGMITASIGGAITGQGADLLIVDDPIKNAIEAASATMRNNVWNEWQATLLTRLHHGGSVIVVQTRWHQDDLIGRILDNDDEFIRIRLPALAEEDDLLNREEGQPLCPELGYGYEWAEQKKKEVGSRTWASLYQQRPTPAGGGLIKREWFKYYDMHQTRYYQTKIISWDLTFKKTQTSDYAVGQVWGKLDGKFYLIDEVRAKMNFTEAIRAVESLFRKHHDAVAILVEDKANGPAVINTLKTKIPRIIPINPKASKEERANMVTPLFEAGAVYIPEQADFTNDYVEELITFPNASHDDRLDSTTQALSWLEKETSIPVGGFTGSVW